MSANQGPDPVAAIRPQIEKALAVVRDMETASHVEIALRLALRTIDSRKVDVTALIDAGHRLEDQGRYEVASEYYKEAVRLEPDAPRSWTNLGEAHRKLEAWDKAADAYGRALDADPDYLWALAGRGESLRMLGRLEDSVKPFQRALAKSPDNLLCLQGLAAALSELQRHREALPHWERALRLRPDSGFASDGLARCHAAMAAESAQGSADA